MAPFPLNSNFLTGASLFFVLKTTISPKIRFFNMRLREGAEAEAAEKPPWGSVGNRCGEVPVKKRGESEVAAMGGGYWIVCS